MPHRDAPLPAAPKPDAARPAHHLPDGRFTNPWLSDADQRRGFADLLRWSWERRRSAAAKNPPPGALPLATPDVAVPRAPDGEVRLTWVGHSTFLVQAGGLNVLTDPLWSRRASPLQWMGPARFVRPGIDFDALPPIHAVLLSHDHYDHLDEPTVRRLDARFGRALRWFAPLGHAAWLRRRGVETITEMDWWDEADVEADGRRARVTCLPAQHWTRRSVGGTNTRLWASFALRTAGGRGVYYGADSGYFAGYAEIGRRAGPFDAVLMPIGAYEPRWFMKPAHMNPEEAARAYADLGGRGVLAAMHWGTFRLTDEDPMEPPVRMRAAWRAAGLPERDLWIAAHGETRVVPPLG